jgi:sugar transferase (PEP-CTERM/EpsH1 system associated)
MLAHRIPYPPHTGDKVRAYHVARHLARKHDVTLGCLIDDRTDRAGLAALRELVGRVEHANVWKPWGVVKGLAALGVGRPLSFSYFGSRRLRARLAGELAGYDLVYVSSTPMAQYVRGLRVPVVVDFVDVDSDKWTQYGQHCRGPRRWLYRAEGRRLRQTEAEIARWASLCLFATSSEETLLKSFAPWARTAVVPNGIDLGYYAPVKREAVHANILFTGAMDYMPNIDAVQHFSADILPRIRRAVPDARFWIVGLNPSAEVRRLADLPGVFVTGTVPDVRPYYERAAVCVAPLRIGRGIQNKVIQGMAMGLPVVVSTLAGRGIDAQSGRQLYVEDEAAAFADRVVDLLGDASERKAVGRRARAFVEANHSWEGSLGRMDGLLRELSALPSASAPEARTAGRGRGRRPFATRLGKARRS